MRLDRELNNRLFVRREEQQSHVEYREEFGFYSNVAEGNVEAVKKILADPENKHPYDSPVYGRLSADSLRNVRYHFVVSVALITRLCVEKGLERELAYTLSDLYISKMDALPGLREILSLQNEMLLDFAEKMAKLPKSHVYSMQVVRAIDYIKLHRNEHLTVKKVAEALKVNRSYLSTLFSRETKSRISAFIRREKIEAAANMLRFSDYSYADIAEYFGFASQSHFIQCFQKEMGETPFVYRKRILNEEAFFR
ncbi:MAG: helix-turn-helix domain-containing protein [Lachnospiraceae bacterium]|nr:helix-turn-helix domain-containing protein [Lachnospiraceae bacterium]